MRDERTNLGHIRQTDTAELMRGEKGDSKHSLCTQDPLGPEFCKKLSALKIWEGTFVNINIFVSVSVIWDFFFQNTVYTFQFSKQNFKNTIKPFLDGGHLMQHHFKYFLRVKCCAHGM